MSDPNLNHHCLDDLIEQYQDDELGYHENIQLWLVGIALVIAVIALIL